MFSGLGVYKATNLEDKTLFVKNVVLPKGKDAAWLDKLQPIRQSAPGSILFILSSH
jgi:hypothetical protein